MAVEYFSQLGQDRWIIEEVYPGKVDGYFVELGASDGVFLSNTYALEKMGWDGVCIEPATEFFKRLQVHRRCCCANDYIGEAASKLPWAEVDLSYTNGNPLFMKKRFADRAGESRLRATVALHEVLDRFDVPTFIEYLSLDVEGAELLILQNFDFSKYIFGAITVEHNRAGKQKRAIRDLLEKQGYRFVRSDSKLAIDDYYIRIENG